MKSVNSIYSKKSSRKAKKRRILLALLMLLLTGVMTATSTFAWFTANKTVSVSTINVNVAASSGLQISVDAADWKPVITTEDLESVLDNSDTYAENLNQLPSESLSPVSSVGDIDESNGTMKMFLGSVQAGESGDFELVAESDVEHSGRGGHYVAFDLFFQVSNKTNIYLTNASKVTGGQDNDTGIQNAARVAFINKGNKPSGTSIDEIQKLNVTSNNNAGKAYIWEPNYDTHKDSAIQHAKSVYNKDITSSEESATEYWGIKANIGGANAQQLNSQDTSYFEKVTPKFTTKTSDGIPSSAYQELFELEAGVTKVRIYMWVEGQDVDCEDNESGGQINFDLGFSIQSSATGD